MPHVLRSGEENSPVQLTADGGVSKTVIRPGESGSLLHAGDEVAVHYRGMLPDGTEFDSSYKRQKPFKFTLGKGTVIKGWDLGVATMARGEKARLICAPKYAYGKKGNPASGVSPNATLAYEVEVLAWMSPRDISGNGGVLQDVLQPGKGSQRPQDIDDVLIRFSIRIQGEEVPILASNGYEEFSLAGKLPIQAFEVALPLMKRGESVALTVKPEYGFEPGHAPEGVPPNPILEATLELVSWITVKEVTPDGLVTKRILKAGKADGSIDRLAPGDRVRVSYVGRLPDGTVFEEWTGANTRAMTVEEGEAVEGLDRAIATMQLGEIAEVIIAPSYAFGTKLFKLPLAVVPSGAHVIYTVELLEVLQSFSDDGLSLGDKIAEADRRKAAGNTFFAGGKWFAALRRYECASRLLQKEPALVLHKGGTLVDDRRRAAAIVKSCALNAAAASLKLERWEAAKAACDEVLEGTSNVKALYRRAEVQLGLDMLPEAEADVRRALLEEPCNRDLRMLLTRIRTASAPHDQHVGRQYANAMAKLDQLESEAEGNPEREEVPKRYPRGCSPADVDLLDPEEVMKHEAMLDAAEAEMADEVRAMKEQMGLPSEPPPTGHRPGNPYRDREIQEAQEARQQRMQKQQRAKYVERGRGYVRPPKLQSRFVPIESPYGGNEPPKCEEPIPALAMERSKFKEIKISDNEDENTSGPEQPMDRQSVSQPAMDSQNCTSVSNTEERENPIQAGSTGVTEGETSGRLALEQEGSACSTPEQPDMGAASRIAEIMDAHGGSEPCSNVEVTRSGHDALECYLTAWDGMQVEGIAAPTHATWELKAQHEATGAEDTLANQLQQAQLAILANTDVHPPEHPANTSAIKDSALGSQPGISNHTQDAHTPPLQPAPGSAAFHDILAGVVPGIAASGTLREDTNARMSDSSRGITDLLADL